MSKRIPTREEVNATLISCLGKDNFNKLEEFGFEYACREADFVGIDKNEKFFKTMILLRQYSLKKDLYDILIETPKVKKYKLKFPTWEEVDNEIRNCYTGGNWI